MDLKALQGQKEIYHLHLQFEKYNNLTVRGMQRKYKRKIGRVCFKYINASFENREVPGSVTSTLDKCRFLCGQVSINTCVIYGHWLIEGGEKLARDAWP